MASSPAFPSCLVRPALPSDESAWRALWRDLRAGELRLLIVAVALAMPLCWTVTF